MRRWCEADSRRTAGGGRMAGLARLEGAGGRAAGGAAVRAAVDQTILRGADGVVAGAWFEGCPRGSAQAGSAVIAHADGKSVRGLGQRRAARLELGSVVRRLGPRPNGERRLGTSLRIRSFHKTDGLPVGQPYGFCGRSREVGEHI